MDRTVAAPDSMRNLMKSMFDHTLTKEYHFWHPPADQTAFPWTGDLALDLMQRMLEPNPAVRITVADALKHGFFEGSAPSFIVRFGCLIWKI